MPKQDLTLSQQIRDAEAKVFKKQEKLNRALAKYHGLLALRQNCDHEFSKPLNGYEHEGGYCTKCGINEVHAECQRIGAKYN